MKKTLLCLLLCLCIALTAVLTACGNNTAATDEPASQAADDATEAQAEGIDYMALVNKTHPLPADWEDKLETVHMTNSVGGDVEVEKKAYDAYLELKKALEAEDVYVDLDSARRSVADQQRIMDEFTEQYGAAYAAKTVAKPGYSEHHTGLALDLYLIIDGKDIVENEDMIQYPEIWEKIHAKLADYGFILRYLDGREHITGYGYEPWHIRYIDDADAAREITSKDMTFEAYLGTASDDEAEIDLGSSELYTEEELTAAAVRIKCQFAFWPGCSLKSIRYAGDDAVTEEKRSWLSEVNPDGDNTRAAEFLMDFRSGENNGETTLEPNKDYTDYQWWLVFTEKDGWDIVSFGY